MGIGILLPLSPGDSLPVVIKNMLGGPNLHFYRLSLLITAQKKVYKGHLMKAFLTSNVRNDPAVAVEGGWPPCSTVAMLERKYFGRNVYFEQMRL